jgi:hypothetical protein
MPKRLLQLGRLLLPAGPVSRPDALQRYQPVKAAAEQHRHNVVCGLLRVGRRQLLGRRPLLVGLKGPLYALVLTCTGMATLACSDASGLDCHRVHGHDLAEGLLAGCMAAAEAMLMSRAEEACCWGWRSHVA